jgi:TRAP-type C4-dicarboxylate transport system permease small subunit
MAMNIAKAVAWMRRRAENIVAGLLGMMFVAFIIQIVFRLLLQLSDRLDIELSVVTWLYMVLIGSAFWLKETEEVRFDHHLGQLGPLGRRVVGTDRGRSQRSSCSGWRCRPP